MRSRNSGSRAPRARAVARCRRSLPSLVAVGRKLGMENNAVETLEAPASKPAAVVVAPPAPPVAAPTHAPEPRRAWFKHLLKLRLFSGEQPKVSPHAVVDKEAEIADDVEIGPFCVIGPHVKIGPGCKLFNNVTIIGHTTIGPRNVFFPNAVIGAPP